MSKIVWDRVENRLFESGLDHGVLYLNDGRAVPWNGLVSVEQSYEKETHPVHFDGAKRNDLVTPGDFVGILTAVTYPNEFAELEGQGKFRRGVYLGAQKSQTFGLCYRTRVGNDLASPDYKLHVLWNLTAVPSERVYASESDDPTLVEFAWNLTAVPQSVPKHMPTAHIVLDSRELDPLLMSDLEDILYGTYDNDPSLMPISDFFQYLLDWYRIKITDNGDGTWTAESDYPEFVQLRSAAEGDIFITGADVRYISDDEYEISTTVDIATAPNIRVFDNGDGTYTISTDDEDVIAINESEQIFTATNLNVDFASEEVFRIRDTNN